MLPLIIAALVPAVVTLIQTLIPAASTPSQTHTWVQGFFKDAANALAKVIPPWLQPEMTTIETVLADLVQAELDKILPNP